MINKGKMIYASTKKVKTFSFVCIFGKLKKEKKNKKKIDLKFLEIIMKQLISVCIHCLKEPIIKILYILIPCMPVFSFIVTSKQ